ncbi:MAG: hypothetical protein GF353_21615 [Candidatus Lokiarchaeota archaeon]|nr:hypothetical protein [Candidatus Lokiarchaeota archaeon]
MAKDDIIDDLISAGIIVTVGYGIYKILKSFGNLRKGSEVNEEMILSESHEPTTTYSSSYQNQGSRIKKSYCVYSGEKVKYPDTYNCTRCSKYYYFNSGDLVPICERCGYDEFIGEDD